MDEKNLKILNKVTPLISRVVDGQSLTAEESEKVFASLFVHDTEGYHLAVFMAAIHAKGETVNELVGLYNATAKLAVKLKIGVNPDRAIDLAGTGGGSFKSINVSTATSFVVAQAGYTVVKRTYYGVTSPTGSADIFEALGIDISKLSKNEVSNALEKIRIAPVPLSSMSPRLANRRRVLDKIFLERQIHIRTPFHLISHVYTPVPVSYRIYGCYSPKYLTFLGRFFSTLGFKRSLIVHAKIGMPEVSNVGETTVIEQYRDKIKEYALRAKDFGAKEASLQDIKTGTKEQNIINFLRILKGKEVGPKADLVSINAACAFYILKAEKDLGEAFKKASNILKSGQAYFKLKELVKAIGSTKKLREWERLAKI